ncbi:RagB/SusD family nutrient uptake outer membrane protein [Allomuricauda sp. CP2A]|uniref:RagB/SusD family nutrient uptake outer membrane protein n=1 Tax=Allomuricauda sp. CP2A TaxID=1848189 RepID=UPI000B2D6906|nr:RagB/SusD family nutrient uptake outer membrane protein [Muricauda sp. CP2A]
MKNNRYKNYGPFVFFMIIALVFMGCSDLEEEVYSEETEDNFFQNADQVMSAYVLPYSFMQTHVYQVHFALQELPTDEVVAPTRNGYEDQDGQWVRLHRHTWTSSDLWIKLEWDNLFQAIGYSNYFLEVIKDKDFSGMDLPVSVEQMEAEIKMVRALHYYWALSSFGNIPIVEQVGDPNPETKSSAEVFAFIEKEIKENIPKLAEKGNSGWYGRFTKSAAQALLAKLYLNAEVFTGTPRWEDCITACNTIMNADFTLDATWDAPFMINNENSDENIFVVPFDANNAAQFNFVQQNLHEEILFNKYNVSYYGWHKFSSQESFFNLYGSNDFRIDQWVVGLQSYIDENGDEQPIWSWIDGQMNITPEITALQSNDTGWEEGAMNIKYEVEVGGLENMSNDMVIFRLADIMLMKAESLMRLNSGIASQEAVELVNEVRSRSFAPDDPEAQYNTSNLTLDELLDERGRELSYEMHRREDFIRFDKYTEPWWEKSESEKYRELYPIPFDVITANPALEQNPGY